MKRLSSIQKKKEISRSGFCALVKILRWVTLNWLILGGNRRKMVERMRGL